MESNNNQILVQQTKKHCYVFDASTTLLKNRASLHILSVNIERLIYWRTEIDIAKKIIEDKNGELAYNFLLARADRLGHSVYLSKPIVLLK